MLLKGSIRKARRGLRRAFGKTRPRRRGADAWHWFDHPEMQARIARAEDDLAHGRSTVHSAEDYLKRLRDA